MRKERWRPVKGWPYEVSDRGRVRRAPSWRGCGQSTSPGRIMRPVRPTHYGYMRVTVSHPAKGPKSFLIHRLVALAFLRSTRRAGYVVNHIDGDKTNNCVENLEWVSHKTNRNHCPRCLVLERENKRLKKELDKRRDL